MENNVDTTSMTIQSFCNDSVPSLSRLVAEKIAKLVELDELPHFDHPLIDVHSNEVFEILRQRKRLNSKTLKTLNSTRFHINKVSVCCHSNYEYFNCFSIDLMGNRVSQDDLECCAKHNLKFLRLGDVDYLPNTNKIQIAELLSKCLNEWSRANLKHLDLSGRHRITSSWPIFVAKHLPSIESLAFANRSTANETLMQIGSSMKNLRFLDISNTCVTDITCIAGLTHLEVLLMYNLNILKGDVTGTLSNLKRLRVLDISRKVNSDYLNETSQDAHLDVALGIYNRSRVALETGLPTPWSDLRVIDMSGLGIVQFGTDRALEFVNSIVEAHPKLEQIALIATPLDSQTIEYPNRNLRVINAANRKTILFALSHYSNLDRPAFTAHALHSVYYLLQSGYDKFKQEELRNCLHLVCLSMQRHLTTLAVQIAGSACLYHLCKMKRIKRLSVRDVSNCIERSLDAAEQYRSMTQLQKNVWLTICNDYLLHLEGIDFYRTCKVALDTMLSNRDASVERMTIAIVSIVTPKIKPPQAHSLTTDSRYVIHLVKIMKDYLEAYSREHRSGHNERENDNTLYTLKFTLSALWNLTDECDETCTAFLNAGGVDIAFKILNVFSVHGNVQTKVLGILNNVAEVEDLNLNVLCKEDYITVLLDCLDGNFMDVDAKGRYRDVERSYFAAGILANMLLDSNSFKNMERREEVCERLIESIEMWPELPSAMVSYRSFKPFCRIVEKSRSNGAMMWCLWGVHHVLKHRDTNNAPHFENGYISMLIASDLWLHCENIARSKFTPIRSLDFRVMAIAQQIVDIVTTESSDLD